ncbi:MULTISPECIES: A/G-specific adenine glycosylase [Pacificibacter]|uniref:A/G-specific adenine glycosylase n=1 Tax=Pacificibacter TaxID=1042323 RepID=UPI001C083808|nr:MULTISPECIES: A/G-specific adenine glycosylase [Pacificibacter]MBU2936034.1 A/G-specific adenine glycosylase [Pacificibacter marinus]MDO6615117.1 A/G-specific adenine glycosylase [Pacificibacter sp. 1_MG-2023]
MKHGELAQSLLTWYDKNARDLPWRVSPSDRATGVHPDPYRIWLSEIMLQQTTVAAVKAYFERFTHLWPTVQDLAAAPDDQVMGEWAGLGYYARARNLLKGARAVVADHDSVFPQDRTSLLALPGIGPYTASAVASIAFDLPETVVDGNVERVMSRLHDIHEPLPLSKPQLTELATRTTPQKRAGDYAQAIMDLGATVCTPKSPKCEVCPWVSPCLARKNGTASELPKKVPKPVKPTRRGFAYVSQTASGAWVMERRADKGLLGGMLGWPGSPWDEVAQDTPPFAADWTEVGEIKHTFTHFHLFLRVMISPSVENTPEALLTLGANEFQSSDLPTVMRKVFDVAQPHFGQ